MKNKEILLEINGNCAKLTLNRPDKLNAFNPIMLEQFDLALSQIAADYNIRCLLITGAGRGFCAGQDLSERDPKQQSYDLGETLGNYYNPLITKLFQLPIPKICAVNGVAAGAGIAISLACDIVYAARSAKFAMAFGKIGLVPDSGLSWLLPRLVGITQAKVLLLSNATLSAEQAKQLNIIYSVIDNELLQTTAQQMATKLSLNSKVANRLTLQLLKKSNENSFVEQLECEKLAQQTAGYSAEYKEGINAFLEKRTADFTKF